MAKNTSGVERPAHEGKPLECGLIMPISPLDGCSAEHWAEVREFLTESISQIEDPAFSAKLVSEEADVGMILRRIVQNVYTSDIVVCDVSGKNANVMFELGMRLAFDKPVVIVKDDKTDYSFDTSVIEHLEYPRDLRYSSMIEFRAKLKAKVKATYEKSLAAGYEGFLKNFGTFKVAHLEERTGSIQEAILESLQEVQRDIAILQRTTPSHELYKALTIADIAAKKGVRFTEAEKKMAFTLGSTEAELAAKRIAELSENERAGGLLSGITTMK